MNTSADSKRLTITIDCDNDAFFPDPQPEIQRILSKIAQSAAFGPTPYQVNLRDINGNKVGEANFAIVLPTES